MMAGPDPASLDRQPGETLVEYVARLERIDRSGLSALEQAGINFRLQHARQEMRRAGEEAPLPRLTPLKAPAPLSPLDAAKQAVRALSAEELSQFMLWI